MPTYKDLKIELCPLCDSRKYSKLKSLEIEDFETLFDEKYTIINLQYGNVKEEIDNFKKELEKQQKLNDELNNNLEEVKANNKVITQLLAENDIIKNSLADPQATEDTINEEVDLFFGAIDCASDSNCVQPQQ